MRVSNLEGGLVGKLSLVAFDLDGTVIDGGTKPISPRVRRALSRAHDLGALTCVATARPPEFLSDELREAAWVDLFSVSDGAMVIDHATGDVIISHPLGRERALDIIDSVADLGALWELYALDACYCDAGLPEMASARDDRNYDWTPELFRGMLTGMREVGSCRELVASGRAETVKLDCLLPSPEASVEAEARLAARDDIEFARMFDVSDFEITARGVDKGASIARVIEHFGLDPAEVVAFGDSGNDISMTGRGYRFVAMGNATPEIKAAADEVCPTIQEDGVAVWLESHLP